ncbi:MAG: DUF2127 domain-containing protein [Chthoniobacterales bacterium]|nr:DUF2127 domain-containing protein [Chthoniobacterales bacterium]
MSDSAPIQKMLQPKRRIRFLRIIAIFKIMKGFLLLSVGVSLLFLNSRAHLLDAIGDWAGDELALVHSRPLLYLLNQLQVVVAGGQLRVTGLVSLFYAAVLFTEGTGVYFQQRWAELLMVFATAALIPFEIHHLWYKPSTIAAIILAANIFIVWFLYRVLRREKRERPAPEKREVATVR